MIAESYDLVTYSPTKRIYEAVKRIPKGCVATYGQVAAMAGEPKMARAVGNALHKNPDPEHIPCYRVVNSKENSPVPLPSAAPRNRPTACGQMALR